MRPSAAFALAACLGCSFAGDYQHQEQVVEHTTTERTVVSGSSSSTAVEVTVDPKDVVDAVQGAADGWINYQTGGLGGTLLALVGGWFGHRHVRRRRERRRLMGR